MRNSFSGVGRGESTTQAIAAPPEVGPGVARFSRWTFWITNSSLTLLDQGLISGSNFLIGILLARWLSPAQYGAYALAFAIFLLLTFFYQALLLEPQRVFGPSEYSGRQREYLGVLLRMHTGLAFAIFLALGATAGLVYEFARPDGLAGALAGVTFAAPCILLLWLARGAFYVRMSPRHAATGAVVYCATVLSGLFLLYRLWSITPFSAFLLMGLGALASSALLLIWLRPTVKSSAIRIAWRTVGAQNWEYGRWVLASLGLFWIAGDMYYPLLGSAFGMAATGELKALLNFTLPINQVFSALGLLLLPYASRTVQEKGLAAFKQLVSKVLLLFGAGSVAYWTCLILWAKPVLRGLYGGHYTNLAPLIPLVAAGSLPWNLMAADAIALRALRSTASLFRTYCACGMVALVIGVPATWMFGVRGVLIATVLSNVAAMVVAHVLVNRKRCVSVAPA